MFCKHCIIDTISQDSAAISLSTDRTDSIMLHLSVNETPVSTKLKLPSFKNLLDYKCVQRHLYKSFFIKCTVKL